MHSNRIALTLLLTAFLSFPIYLLSRVAGAPARRTGGDFPGEQSCATVDCHGGQPNTGPGAVAITINGQPLGEYRYQPGETVPVVVQVNDPDQRRWGFQVTARTSDGCLQAGEFAPSPNDSQVQITPTGPGDVAVGCPPGVINFPTHRFPKAGPGGAAYEVNWTAPATNIGPVLFAAAGNAANGNNMPTGDRIYTVQGSAQPQAGSGSPPPEISSLVNAATFGADGLISPGSIVTMFVANILTSEQLAVFPATEFEGASITIGGQAAPLFDVVPSRNQINLLAPTELMESGNAEVRVTNGEGQSATLSAELVSASPGIFRIPVVSAPERNDAVVVLNNTRWFTVPDSVSEAIGLPTGCEERGVNPASFCGRPAQPGDALQIFLTGLGRATPGGDPSGDPLPTGEVAPLDGNPLYRTVDRPVVTIGDLPAQVLFSGLTPGFAGLYQINVFVPEGALGGDDIALTVSMPNGASDTATIAIEPWSARRGN